MSATPRPPACRVTREFAARYREERARLARSLPCGRREEAGELLARRMLAAQQGRGSRQLRDWLAPIPRHVLSAALEAVLERDERQKRLGAYATGADVAAYMACHTILPLLLAEVGHAAEPLADLVTCNRGPETVLLDWITSRTDRADLWTLWRRLESLTVLDPTCGTGAFLTAALRVLRPIREACLRRMDQLGVKLLPGAAEDVARRIVEQNLFGIDLLPEAVEVCRLRLRLEAGADVRDNLRVGNCLTSRERKRPEGQPPVAHAPGSPGFDVILGNPPYLELREVDYTPRGFRCQDSGAVHALCVERGLELLQPRGWMSMIVPLSVVSTQRMQCVQDLLEEGRNVWYANFSWRPARLFPEVNRAMTLFVATASDRPRTWTTGYQKWRTRERSHLMSRIRYTEAPRARPAFWVPKLSDECERPLLEKLLGVPTAVEDFLASEDSPERRLYYRTDGGLYWKVFTDFAPSFSSNGQAGHSTRETWVTAADAAHVAPLIAALSSDLFWWWYTVTSNCRHLNPIDVRRFPLPAPVLADGRLARLGREYLRDIVRHSTSRVRRQRQTGRTQTQTFKIRNSRPLLLEIGRALAPHYGLTESEREHVAAYDQEFRLGP